MFRLNNKSNKSEARLGTLITAHGRIRTPFFMPVATQAALKHISVKEIKKLKAQILLANTYHLMLRPGEKMIKKLGGLHAFMAWDGPVLTDSGGFQIFSLAGIKKQGGNNLVRLSRDGVKFKSYIDGSSHYLTPERSLKIQAELGVDIAVCLDVCSKLPATKEELGKALALTTHWAKKAKKYHARLRGKKPLFHCVIQGGLDKELRLKSLRELKDIGFSALGKGASGWDGYNIGGLSVGESAAEMYKVLDYLVPEMPADKPRYLMGVGYPENIVEAVKRGVDMFDCVIPSREGRHGRLFQWKRNPKSQINSKQIPNPNFQNLKQFYLTQNINNSKFAGNKSPINAASKMPVLRNYSLAYLHYLFKIKEPLGARLATLNNIEFYFDLMAKIRYAIKLNKL